MELVIYEKKIKPGSEVNVKWKDIWYDGTVLKIGPKGNLSKIAEIGDKHEFLVEANQLKHFDTDSGEFHVAYNDGESWLKATIIDSSAEGAAKISWRKNIHAAEIEMWFELENISPIIRNEVYYAEQNTLQASKSGMLPSRMLDEHSRTVQNVLYQSGNDSDEPHLTDVNYSTETESNVDSNLLPTLPEDPMYLPMWKPSNGPMLFPQVAINKAINNISQTSIPCSWSYSNRIPRPSGGIAPHYASGFFRNFRTKKDMNNNSLLSGRNIFEEKHREKIIPSKSSLQEKNHPRDLHNNQVEEKHFLFDQFFSPKVSRIEDQTSDSEANLSGATKGIEDGNMTPKCELNPNGNNQNPPTDADIQTYLDSIVNGMEVFNDSLESTPPHTVVKVKPVICNTAVMADKSTTNTDDHLGEIEQYLVGYGDDYGALSSKNITHVTNTSSSLRGKQGRKVAHGDYKGDINTVSIISVTDGAHDSNEQLMSRLTSLDKSILDGFQLSFQTNREAKISLKKRCQKAPKRWLGGIFSKKRKSQISSVI